MTDKPQESAKMKPLNTDMNAQRWAKEFMSSKFAERLPPEVDESLMIAWFANAIMCGWDNRGWQQAKDAATIAELRDYIKLLGNHHRNCECNCMDHKGLADKALEASE